jgi:CRISPR-associated protein Csm1
MKRETIYLAALLHDIGKFWQRADPNGAASSRNLETHIKGNEGLFCPVYNGKYSHKHVLWTAQFLDKYQSFFKSILNGDNYESFFKASVKHHALDQDDLFQKIVQKADHYASGADRTKEMGIKDAEAENNWDSFKNVQMVSIFEGIGKSSTYLHEYKVPIQQLSLGDDHFPYRSRGIEENQPLYSTVWNNFEREFQHLITRSQDLSSFSENLLFLLFRYASSVPSSTVHLPDVSLYDHLKSVGIFALCIYDYLEENQRLTIDFQLSPNEAPILLVGGDLSGIQNYIYDIVSTDAARNLKGRSFYLQLLVENAVELILRETNLPWSSVVYASGGGFYLLAPNTKHAKDSIERAYGIITSTLFKEHKTSLSLSISYQEVSQRDVLDQGEDFGIHKAWGKLTQKIAQLKGQKFKDQIIRNYDFFFSPTEIGGTQKRDYITGEELQDKEPIKKIDDDGNHMVKASTYNQIQLGRKLKDSDYWITSKDKIAKWSEHEYRIGELPVYNYILSNAELENSGIRNPDDIYIRSFDIDNSSSNSYSEFLRGNRCIYGFTFYGGNKYPVDEKGNVVTFNVMADRSKGSKKLGVLRMDVDNLGAIFIAGLGNERKTFSRYSVLSRSLDYFFKGYLNRLWATKYKDGAYIIYSGGDDLFIVGQWNAIFEYAEDIQKEFTRWVCHNPTLTISGGIALIGGSFPISKGAVFAAEAEEKAKEYSRPNPDRKSSERNTLEKNAISLFNKPLGWGKEYLIIKEIKNRLVELIDRGHLPRGILQKLMAYSESARKQDEAGSSQQWKWKLAYDFSRASKRMKNQELDDFYSQIRIATFNNSWNGEYLSEFTNNSLLDLLEVSARWAELETK